MVSDSSTSDEESVEQNRIGSETLGTMSDEKPDSAESDQVDSGTVRTDDRASNAIVDALIGGTVTAITAFLIPLSPLVGGAIAGYLEGATEDNGLKIGALSGAIALIPLVVIVPLALFLFVLKPIAAVGVFFVATLAVGFLAVYTIGLGALGGLLGVYLYDEFGAER